MSDPPILLETSEEGVATLTLNRPDAANAINLDFAMTLERLAATLEADHGVRAVLVRGTGRMFCGGGDLKDFDTKGDALPAYLRQLTGHLHAGIATLARLDAPVVAAVHGAAAGAGLGLALACDLVIAAASARFVMAYTKAGVSPDGSITWSLPRLVGQHRALELALTNRTLSADEALAWGLVMRVVPDEALAAESEAFVRTLAAGATGAFGGAKRLIRSSFGRSIEDQTALETIEVSAAAGTPDGREGISAFVEKREPRFRGP